MLGVWVGGCLDVGEWFAMCMCLGGAYVGEWCSVWVGVSLGK